MKLDQSVQWKPLRLLFGSQEDRVVWFYAYSWQEVRRTTLKDAEDFYYEFSHWCDAPENADQDYLLATGHYAWANALGMDS